MDDDALSFYYADRELTVTRAPGFRLESTKGGKPHSTRNGPSLDLLLRNATDDKPILAEVKIERDKDPFFAFIQVLMAATYIQPAMQRQRLMQHDAAFNLDDSTLDTYLLLVEFEGNSDYWPQLFELTKKIASDTAADLSPWVRRTAAINLEWDGKDPESLRGTRLF